MGRSMKIWYLHWMNWHVVIIWRGWRLKTEGIARITTQAMRLSCHMTHHLTIWKVCFCFFFFFFFLFCFLLFCFLFFVFCFLFFFFFCCCCCCCSFFCCCCFILFYFILFYFILFFISTEIKDWIKQKQKQKQNVLESRWENKTTKQENKMIWRK